MDGGESGGAVETLAVVTLVVLSGVALLLWATAAISGRLSSGLWPDVSAADLPSALVSILQDPANPDRAFSTDAARLLPGALGFWGVAAAIVAVAGALVTAVLLLLLRFTGRSKGGAPAQHAGARWARLRDLSPLIVRRPVSGRLSLGYCGRRLIACEPRMSTIVFGPSQSGKTAGIAIPAILEAEGPVVAVSVKRDLLQHTLAARQRKGRVLVYDPTGAAGCPPGLEAGWDPVRLCGDWATAQRLAGVLATAIARPSRSENEFWSAMAVKLIAPMLLAAACTRRGLREVLRWLDSTEIADVEDGLRASGVQEALDAFQATLRREERTRSSIYATAESILAAYADPGVLGCADLSGVRTEELLSGINTLYIVAPSDDQERLAPVFAVLIEEVLRSAIRRSDALDNDRNPLLVLIDEAANTAPLRRLPTIASTAAGQGVQLVTVFQDLAQVRARYGDATDTVVSNHRAKVFLSGISCARTLDYLSRLLGDEEVARESRTRALDGRSTTTTGTRQRQLAPVDVVRGIRPGEGVLVYGHLPPAWIRLRPWFEDCSPPHAGERFSRLRRRRARTARPRRSDGRNI